LNVFANPQAINVDYNAVLWRGNHGLGQIQLCSVQLRLGLFYRRMLIDRQISAIAHC
jgi:hypothetical protein